MLFVRPTTRGYAVDVIGLMDVNPIVSIGSVAEHYYRNKVIRAPREGLNYFTVLQQNGASIDRCPFQRRPERRNKEAGGACCTRGVNRLRLSQ